MSKFDKLVEALESATTAAKDLKREDAGGGPTRREPRRDDPPATDPRGRPDTGPGRKDQWKERTNNYGEYGALFGKEFEEKFFRDAEQSSRKLWQLYGRRLVDTTDGQLDHLQTGTNKVFTRLSERLRDFSADASVSFDEIVKRAPGQITFLNTLAQQGNAAGQQSALRLLTTVGQFREISVNAGQNAMRIADTMTMAFEAPTDKATALLHTMRDMTSELGISTEKLSEDYLHLSKNMAYSLEEINKQFRKLEIQSRSTGIPVKELTNAFGKQLDTFEGSATAAGRLNAILGTSSINALELLTMKEGERVEYIKNAMKGAGVSLAELTKGKGFGLRAISEAVGLDLENTRRLLSGKSEEVFQSLGGEELTQKDINKELVTNTGQLDTSIKRLGSEIRASHGTRTQLYLEMRRAHDLSLAKATKVTPGDWSRVEALMMKLEKTYKLKKNKDGVLMTEPGEKFMKWAESVKQGDTKTAALINAAIAGYQIQLGAAEKKAGKVLGPAIAAAVLVKQIETLRKDADIQAQKRDAAVASAIEKGFGNVTLDTHVYIGTVELNKLIDTQVRAAVTRATQ